MKVACRAELWLQALGQHASTATQQGWFSLVRGDTARAHRLGQLQNRPKKFKPKPDTNQLSLRSSVEQGCWSTGTGVHTEVLCKLLSGAHHSKEGGQCWDVALGRPVTPFLKPEGLRAGTHTEAEHTFLCWEHRKSGEPRGRNTLRDLSLGSPTRRVGTL